MNNKYKGVGDEDGVCILLYGHPKTGKSTAVGDAFRNAAWITTERGGLIPVKRCLGYEPKHVFRQFSETDALSEFDRILDQSVIPMARDRVFSTVVIDTVSTFSERVVAGLLKQESHGLRAFGLLQDIILERTDKLRNMGIWVILIAHRRPPEHDAKTGIKLRGGPEFPGKKLTRSIPAKVDMAIMADVTEGSLGNPARRVLRCDPLNADYIMGDRFGVTLPEQDLNLAPIRWRIVNPGQPVPDALHDLGARLTIMRPEPTPDAGQYGL